MTGTYEVTAVGGERVNAFIPAPLPPNPSVILGGTLQRVFEGAGLAMGRLDGVSALLPEMDYLLYSYVRKEAVLSSQIEGTQSSLSDLLLYELEEAPGVPLDDVVEVSHYVAALEHGLARLKSGFPLSNRLIREIHAVLLSEGRGSGKEPGDFRRSQNWIGGSRPGNAVFVPPPHTSVQDCMADLERFLHGEDDLPVLVRAGLAHLQFETIHPFLDGNGRVGRLLITLMLCQAGVLRKPCLYLSLYLKKNRSQYYELLDQVRKDGDWEAWLEFFLEGVRETADGAVSTSRRLAAKASKHRERLSKLGRRAGSALRVHMALERRPILSLQEAARLTQLSFPTVASAMELLVENKIVRELTGKRRNRLFVYSAYLKMLNEGTERTKS